jgi:hypothetical protein
MGADHADAVAEQMLDEARAEIAAADKKASILLATLGVGFGAVLGGQLSGTWDPSLLSPCGGAVWWTGVCVAILAVGAAALAVWPRYGSEHQPKKVAYWGHAATFKGSKELRQALKAQNLPSPVRTADQLWHVSRIVRTKYRLVRSALVLGAAAGLLLAIAVITLH